MRNEKHIAKHSKSKLEDVYLTFYFVSSNVAKLRTNLFKKEQRTKSDLGWITHADKELEGSVELFRSIHILANTNFDLSNASEIWLGIETFKSIEKLYTKTTVEFIVLDEEALNLINQIIESVKSKISLENNYMVQIDKTNQLGELKNSIVKIKDSRARHELEAKEKIKKRLKMEKYAKEDAEAEKKLKAQMKHQAKKDTIQIFEDDDDFDDDDW